MLTAKTLWILHIYQYCLNFPWPEIWCIEIGLILFHDKVLFHEITMKLWLHLSFSCWWTHGFISPLFHCYEQCYVWHNSKCISIPTWKCSVGQMLKSKSDWSKGLHVHYFHSSYQISFFLSGSHVGSYLMHESVLIPLPPCTMDTTNHENVFPIR